METPWGDIAVSDAHVHFFSHNFFAQLKPAEQVHDLGPLLGWEMPPQDPVQLAARWVQELDRHGVSRAALIASVPGDEASVEAAVKAYPERFFGFFIMNPLAPDAMQRLEQAQNSGTNPTVCLFPAMHRYSIADERVQPLLERIAATPRATVFVHCGVLTVGVRKKLGLASLFDMRFSNPIDLHPVALRLPHVNFIVPHFGAGYFREALMLADLCPNVYLDTSSTNNWMRYYEPALALRDVLRRALDVLGPKRLLFGSESSFFPRGWHQQIFDLQCRALYEVGLQEEDARQILGENLLRLLA